MTDPDDESAPDGTSAPDEASELDEAAGPHEASELDEDLRIAAAVVARPGRTVGELAGDLPFPPATVSRTLDALVDGGAVAASDGYPTTYRPSPSEEWPSAAGRVADDHPLSALCRAYGERVVCGTEWPLGAVDLDLIAWRTSTRAASRHGRCAYGEDGACTVAISEHTFDRGGFAACRETVRHELVHAWQHQHAGERVPVADDGSVGPVDGAPDEGRGTDPETISIEPGHGPSFRAWVGPLALEGRCARHYERSPADYAYVVECPSCRNWWGRHRLCDSVRQAAGGAVGPAGYRYCASCEVLLYLRSGTAYLEHGAHEDDAIRAFADGDRDGLPTVPARDAEAVTRPGDE